MTFRERPDSWYESPDEPSDAQYDACREAWEEYLLEFCENGDRWISRDDEPHCDELQPCAACADSPPMPLERFSEGWFNDRQDR
jgi:hypothetical protein